MRKYSASSVAPFSLLVPVVGLTSAYLFLGEYLTVIDLMGAILVIIGLIINIFGGKLLIYIKKAVSC